jgi:hypothetical protein
MRTPLAAPIFAGLVSLVGVVGSSTAAFAQAPGDYSGDASGAPGMMAPVQPQPVVVASPCSSARDVMANRWAVGLSAGTLGVAPDSSPDAKASFDVGELSLRFRATRHLELEGAVGGGHMAYSDGSQSSAKVQTAALSLRYRFAVEHNWNWWLMGGFGIAALVDDSATQDQISQATRALGQLGLGLEHRWNHFALQAELKAIAMDQTKAEKAGTVASPQGSIGRTSSGDTLSGGVFTLGASYYF